MKFFLALPFLLLFISCDSFQGKKGTVAPTRDLLKGKKLYLNHCAGCHQIEGEGLGKIYPPLANSDYLNEHFKELPCIIRKGMHKDITVNGKPYNYEMYPVKGLNDYDIAAVCNYISFTWQIPHSEILTKEKVTAKVNKCK